MLEVLGSGTFASTKRAYWAKGEREVAVKVMKKELLKGDAASAVNDELSLLEGLEHPNIVKLYDYWESRQKWYLSFGP